MTLDNGYLFRVVHSVNRVSGSESWSIEAKRPSEERWTGGGTLFGCPSKYSNEVDALKAADKMASLFAWETVDVINGPPFLGDAL